MRKCIIGLLLVSIVFVFHCATTGGETGSKDTASKPKSKSKKLEIVSPLSGEKMVAQKQSPSSSTAYFVATGRFNGLDPARIFVYLKYPNQNVFYRASEAVTVTREGEWKANVFFGNDKRPATVGDVVEIIVVGKASEDMKTFNIMTARDVVTSDWQKNISIATLR